MPPVLVHVVSSDPGLRRAVIDRLGRGAQDIALAALESCDDLDSKRAEVVVVPASECSAECCRTTASLGASVIVLAPVARAAEKELFLRAGAAGYVPMDIDSKQLLAEVRRVVGSRRQEDAAARCRARVSSARR